MEVAVRHLVELGHTKIAHMAGPPGADTARRRLAGFRHAMRQAGLPAAAASLARASVSERDGYETMLRLLKTKPRPTAVVVWSLSAAVGALAAARRIGARVPADVSVVAFHDAEVAEYLEPALTTVRMPLFELSEMGVKIMLELIEGKQVRSVVVESPPPLLVERHSTGAAP
jgi:LacI family transcriptional regulator